MIKSEVIELLKYISGAYGRFAMNENTPNVWLDVLKDQSFDKTMFLLKKHIAESRFEPSISDLVNNYKPEQKEKEVQIYYGRGSGENDN